MEMSRILMRVMAGPVNLMVEMAITRSSHICTGQVRGHGVDVTGPSTAHEQGVGAIHKNGGP